MRFTQKDQKELDKLNMLLGESEDTPIPSIEMNMQNTMQGTQNTPAPEEKGMLEGFFDSPSEIFKRARYNPTPMQAGVNDEIANLYGASKATLTGGEYNPQVSGEGFRYQAGKLSPYLIPGPHQATMLRRLLTAGTLGGLTNPEDPTGGAKTSLGVSGALEAAPYVGKGLGMGFDKLTRSDLSKEMMGKMQQNFSQSKEKAMSYLNPLLDQFGGKVMKYDQVKVIREQYKSAKKVIGSLSKSAYEAYEKHPTFEKAQRFQSSLADSVRKIKGKGSTSISAIEELNSTRDTILDQMGVFMDNFSPEAKNMHQNFRDIYREQVVPYLNNPTTNKIVHGETSKISPKRMSKELTAASEGVRSKVPQSHEIRDVEKIMKDKLARSDLYTGALTGLAGGAALGPAGLLLGGLPKVMSRMGIDFAELLQNPQFAQLLSKGYPTARAGITGAAVSPGQEYVGEDIYRRQK